jgi:hypothetical protein
VPLSDIATNIANIEFEDFGALEIDGIFWISYDHCGKRRRSIHRDPRACCAIQKALQMKACELIIRVLADVGGKGRQRAGIVRFKLGKRIEIAGGRRVLVLFRRERLEDAQRLGFPAQ